MLELDGLTRHFGATTALDGLSFDVPEGRLFGFVGRNGAGKTTAMRIVLGVLAADEGEVRWRGKTIGREARARFGYMPEERGLYPKMGVREQLDHFAALHGSNGDSGALLERLGLGEHAGAHVETLSLGNQQRAQLAVALVHEPELLVLDEPFSGLDPLGVDVLAEVLRERAEAGVSVLFSSHQLELVERLCDGIAIIEAGKLVASGTVTELREEGGWEVQLEGQPAQVVQGERDAVLAEAQRRGGVVRFGPQTLADIFRDKVIPK